MEELKFTLEKNSFSFLNYSLSQAIVAEENPENWKYAILHLVLAIELALKELLRQEHPIFIYKNIDNPTETVSLRFALNRLEKISKLKFDKDDLEAIKLAANYRDAIVHFEFSFKILEIKSIYAKLLGFFQSFAIRYLKKNLSEIISSKLWVEALKIIDYANELQKRAEQRFKEEGIEREFIIECRYCHQFGFVIQDEINICYVCGECDQTGYCSICGEFFYLDELYEFNGNNDGLICEICKNNKERYYLDYYS